MVVDFRSKLNFEPKQVQFVDKVYTLKTDHKTGLLLQELYRRIEKDEEADGDTKILKLVYGEKQYDELMEELEKAAEKGSMNYDENIKPIIWGTMSVLHNRPYEDFEKAAGQTEKK